MSYPSDQPSRSSVPGAASKETNEYIPAFIAKKPFYIETDEDNADYLEHQRLQKAAQSDQSKWYDRGKKLGPAATKYRKGACENCGAMTHKTKECLSRPRAKGAKWTGKDIQADEVVQKVDLGWDAKRDRWNGYDAKDYKSVIEDFNLLQEMKNQAHADSKKDDGDEEEEDDAKYAEESDMGRQQPTSTRQLRIREDTAKYLLNLDLDSAKYDPKTRSMVDGGATQDIAAKLVAEEGFMRSSGDAAEFEKAQKYAWESQEKTGGTKIHLQANPTSGELLRKQELEQEKQKREAHRKLLAEKYGGDQFKMPAALRDAAVTESERFVEYDDSGAIKGSIKPAAKSKYAEDVLINNHTSVWGSWWTNFQWGYACCHATVKNSYCTGEAGKKAFEDAEKLRTGNLGVEDIEGEQTEDAPKEIEWRSETTKDNPKPPASSKTEAAVKKRTIEEMKDGVTEEEMEEYRRKRLAANDPMAAFLGKDELI